MTQEQRLDYLVEEFKADSVQYKELLIPDDKQEKRKASRCWAVSFLCIPA